jgi:hypothetical protein
VKLAILRIWKTRTITLRETMALSWPRMVERELVGKLKGQR